MPVAICLSGGGAKGDFEVGVVRLLYDRGIHADILAGTSVGAINAVKLAEGEDPASPHQGLPGLEAIWSSLMRNEDMFVEEDWLHDPDMDPRVRDLLTGRSTELGIAPSNRNYSPWGDLAGVPWFLDRASFLLTDGVALLKSLGVFSKRARAIFNLGPISARLHTDLDAAEVVAWGADPSHHLRLGMVGLESGGLRYCTRSTG